MRPCAGLITLALAGALGVGLPLEGFFSGLRGVGGRASGRAATFAAPSHPRLGRSLALPGRSLALPVRQPAAPPPATAPAGGGEEAGFVRLFDGNQLGKWDGDPRFWSVRDGVITGETTRDKRADANTFLVWRGGEVDDFHLRLSVRITGDNNSGIQYRSREKAKWSVGGYQCDIGPGGSARGSHYGKLSWEGGGRDAPLCPSGKKVLIRPDGRRETLGDVGDEEAIRAGMKEGEWYAFEVLAVGTRLVHKVNGQVVADATDEEQGKRAAAGILALQIHGGAPMTVQFKDILLKPLPRP